MIYPFKRLIFGSCLVLFVLAGFAVSAQDNLKLWYTKPATYWEEALPVGNGSLAVMVFGGVESERIQFNEETLWTGEPRSYAHKGASKYLGQIRSLLQDGKQKEAEELATKEFMSIPLRQTAYQAFGDLYLDFPTHKNFSNYRRELNLIKGISSVKYRSENVDYSREVFASYPAKVIYAHLSSSKKGALSFGIRMDAIHETKKVSGSANEITLEVKVTPGVLKGIAKVKILTDGKVSNLNGSLSVSGASYADLVLSAATTYVKYNDITGNPESKTARFLAYAPKYTVARQQHIVDYQKLFSRFRLNLPESQQAALPTNERLLAFKSNPNDPALLALYVQYARYLLITSSRPGSHAANLQGKWNHQLKPSWDSKYTVNINTEMNYWPVEMTNLSECHEPLFDMLDDLAVTGKEVAQEHYNAPGWMVHHNTDVWRGAAPINGANHGIWVTGGAWLSLHLWERYRFTQDKEFLKNKAYPLLKGAAEFFTSFLVKDPNTGYLISTPSNSPEQGGLVAGPTMDHQIIRALFSACVNASGILGADKAFAEQLKTMIPQISPNKIGRAGQLQEWLTDIDDTTNHHRHVSHLWGVYPGEEITPAGTPKLLEAAKKSLQYRGDDGTGWSLAWKINYWARFLDGEHAYTMVRKLFNPIDLAVQKSGGGSYPNLFDAHPPFQIDGNFGGAAGILELLVQSHLEEIDLLPALPSALPKGEISGLVVRGGFEISMKWNDGKLQTLSVLSKAGQVCKLKYGGKQLAFPTVKGKVYSISKDLKRI